MSGDLRAYVSVEMIPTKLLQQQQKKNPRTAYFL